MPIILILAPASIPKHSLAIQISEYQNGISFSLVRINIFLWPWLS